MKLTREWKEPVPVTAVHLVRIGDRVIVKAEIGSRWVEIIREHHEGSFSHICEASSMRSRLAVAEKDDPNVLAVKDSTMPTTLRDFIQALAKERGIAVDEKLENFIFEVASRWGDRRVAVAEEMRNGSYKAE